MLTCQVQGLNSKPNRAFFLLVFSLRGSGSLTFIVKLDVIHDKKNVMNSKLKLTITYILFGYRKPISN